MIQESPAPSPITFPHTQTGWQYIEFVGPTPAKTTAGAPAGTSNPGGIQAALTWLNQSALPGAGSVFGIVDSQGTVRLCWYGTSEVI